MKLSRDEEAFLRHWIRDEAHYQQGAGPAKLLQIQHGVRPGELAILIAAAIPDTRHQLEIAFAPVPPEPPNWPWSDESFRVRLQEARMVLSGTTAPLPPASPDAGTDGWNGGWIPDT